jgi:hypothetical protein
MLNTLYRSIYTFTANTSFEKVEYNKKEARLEATCNKDYLPPSESSIKILINTFRGLDTETRPQQAFNTMYQLEGACRALGLTRQLGSPVLLCLDRA